MIIINNPNINDALIALRNGISSKNTIVALLHCRVRYEGRGSSVLEYGDRIFIIKQDGAVLIHRPTGYSPVNWQPSTSYIRVSIENGLLHIIAVRNKPREILDVEAKKVYSIVIASLTDTGRFYEVMDESIIRDVIASNPKVLGENFTTIDVEKKIEPGFVDLYLRDEKGRLVVVEIKRVKASVNAVKQLIKYVSSLSKYVPRGKLRPILVAPEFTESAIVAAKKHGVELKSIDVLKLESIRRRELEKRGEGLLRYIR